MISYSILIILPFIIISAIDAELQYKQIQPWKNLTVLLNKKRDNYFQHIVDMYNEEFLADVKEIANTSISAGFSTLMPYTNMIQKKMNGEFTLDGYIGDLWRHLEDALNFKTEFTRDNITDERDTLRNSTYDIILNPVILKSGDVREFGSTMPIAITWVQLSIRVHRVNSQFYLDTWSPTLWLTFTIYVPLLSFIFWIITNTRLISEDNNPNSYTIYPGNNGDTSLMSQFLNIWGCITNQAKFAMAERTDVDVPKLKRSSPILKYTIVKANAILSNGFQIKPHTNSMRIATLAIITFGYIMTSAYSAILISHLATARAPKEMILKDILQQDALSLCVSEKSIGYKEFKISPDSPKINQSWAKILNRSPCTVKQQKADVVPIDDYCNEHSVVFETKQNTNFLFQDITENNRTELCNIYSFKKRYHYSYISLLANKKFKYTRLISIHLLKFHTAGIIKKYQEKWLPSNFLYGDRLDKIAEVNFSHIQFVLLFYILAIILSFLILFIEILIHSQHRELLYEKKSRCTFN